jgi:hypothetical protein
MKERAARLQRGYIFRVGRAWYGRWRRKELVSASELTEKEKRALEPGHDGKSRLCGNTLKGWRSIPTVTDRGKTCNHCST